MMTKRFQFLFNSMLASTMLLFLAGTAAAQSTVPGAVPEIDAGSAASAMTLIVGAAMFLKDKFRTR